MRDPASTPTHIPRSTTSDVTMVAMGWGTLPDQYGRRSDGDDGPVAQKTAEGSATQPQNAMPRSYSNTQAEVFRLGAAPGVRLPIGLPRGQVAPSIAAVVLLRCRTRLTISEVHEGPLHLMPLGASAF